MRLRIKDWRKLQHYKDRKPPWIKLHRDCIDNPDWHELDGETAKTLIGLWCLAAEDEKLDGNLPDLRHIAFRLRISESAAEVSLKKLKSWLDKVDSNSLADCYQSATTETDTEKDKEKYTERDTEREANAGLAVEATADPLLSNSPALQGDQKAQNNALLLGGMKMTATASRSLLPHQSPEGVSETVWRDFLALRKANKSPLTESALKAIRKEAEMAGWPLQRALEECCARGWKSFKAGWVEEKLTSSETRRSTITGLTRGLAIPSRTKTFWQTPTDSVEESQNVERE